MPDGPLDGQVLPRQRGLVDDGLALDDLAVDGDRRLVVDHDEVPHLELGEVHALLDDLAVGGGALDPGGGLAALQQVRDGAAGAAQGEVLEVLADVEQPQDRERDDVLAQQEARDGRGRDEGVGAGAAAADERPDGSLEEGYPEKIVTPVATRRDVGPSRGGRPNAKRRNPSRASAAPPTAMRATSPLPTSADRGVRDGSASAGRSATPATAASRSSSVSDSGS